MGDFLDLGYNLQVEIDSPHGRIILLPSIEEREKIKVMLGFEPTDKAVTADGVVDWPEHRT